MRQEIDLLQFPQVKRELGRRTEEHRVIARRFDREFFDGSRDTGYGGYQYDGRWIAVAKRMVKYYGLKHMDRVLDVGCAKGFLVNDFVAMGIDAYGLDVSGYALANSFKSIGNRLMHRGALDIPDIRYKLIVSINTLHNLDREEMAVALKQISRVADEAYITVDAYRNDEEKERMLSWNLTAKTIMHVDEWREFFNDVGYHGDYGWFIP